MAEDNKTETFIFVLHSYSEENAKILKKALTETERSSLVDLTFPDPTLKTRADNTASATYAQIDNVLTFNRLDQLRGDFTSTRSQLTHHASKNEMETQIGLSVGTVALGSVGLVLNELQEIATERNTELAKMFEVFRKELDTILQSHANEDEDDKIQQARAWISKYNKLLRTKKGDNIDVLQLILTNNQLCLQVTSNLSKTVPQEPEEDTLKKVQKGIETTWDVAYVAPLAYWPIWGGATLVTGIIGPGLALGFGLSVGLGFAVPLTFLAIYLTLIFADYIKDKIKTTLNKRIYDAFFGRTERSKSSNLGTRLVSAIWNFFRYLAGTLLFFTVIIPLILFIYEKVASPQAQEGYKPLTDKETKRFDTTSPLANAIRNVFRKIAITNQATKYATQPAIGQTTIQNNDNTDSSITDDFWKLPSLNKRTVVYALKMISGVVIGGFFMGWFVLDSALLFGTTIAASVLFPIGTTILALAAITTLYKTLQFRESIQDENEEIAAQEKTLDTKLTALKKQQDYLLNLQKTFTNKINNLSKDDPKKVQLIQAANTVPDHKKSGIFKDIENTNNEETRINKIAYTLKVIGYVLTGALFFRMLAIKGTSDLLPWGADALHTGLFNSLNLGFLTITPGVLLFGLIVIAALIYAYAIYTKDTYDHRHNEIKLFLDQFDVRNEALHQEINFYENALGIKKASIETPTQQSEVAISNIATPVPVHSETIATLAANQTVALLKDAGSTTSHTSQATNTVRKI